MEKIQALWKKYFSSFNAVMRVLLGLAIVAFFVVHEGLQQPLELLKRLEYIAYDTRLKAIMPSTPDPRIVVIDIDEKSLIAEGRWPWGRDKVANLIRQSFDQYGAKVLALDVLFSERDTSSGLPVLEQLAQTTFKDDATFQQTLGTLRNSLNFDARLAAEIQRNAVVLAFAGPNNSEALDRLTIGALPKPLLSDDSLKVQVPIIETMGYSANLKEFQNVASGTGHIIPQIDSDGVLRRIPMLIKYENGYYEAFSVAILNSYLDNPAVKIDVINDESLKSKRIDRLSIGNLTIPVDRYATAFVPFRGRTPMFQYVSATDILQGKLQKDVLKGKIALVGTSAQGLLDLRNTPVDNIYPGVEVHASMISGALDGRILRTPNDDVLIRVATFLVIGIPLVLMFARSNPIISSVVALLCIGALIGFNVYWWQNGILLQITPPVLMVLLLYVLNMAYGFFIETRSKKAITNIFGTYVPKELVDEMAKNPTAYSMKGETREMTVLFADVRSFTSISEGLSATELTAMMNAYLTEMTKTIQSEQGTIDKYIGDAIMAFWGAPVRDEKHAEHALVSAMAMQKQIRDIGPEFIKRGWPQLEIGVGLNCGPMNVGDMGSSFRRAYTVMGDAVNLASRLESLTKEYGVGILVSENIVDAVPNMVYRELDRVRVKGKLAPIGIYEPVGKQSEVVKSIVDEIDRFHRALDKYRAQRWDEAELNMASLAAADPTRKVYKIYLERIQNLRNNQPGKNWDGVFTFTTK